ncbi:hypothetical protein [Flavobacterium covae]|uniref:hypothetical protein n=1 Tax=Flavobacterium covae TaxID=2906076 RepID=UPI00339AB591
MRKHLFILILISTISCKQNLVNIPEKKIEKKSEEKSISEKIDDEIQQIGHLYQPERMSIKQNKIRTDNKKENYDITLINSDLLDKDIENIEKHAEKIVLLYYKNLVRNIIPFNGDKILVIIEHRNGKKDTFKFTEKEIHKLTNKNKS